VGGYRIQRFAYFPKRWENVADGAILENVRAHRWSRVQVPFLILAEAAAIRRAVRVFDPDVVHLHWLVPQGVAGLLGARGLPSVVTTHGGDLYGLRGPWWKALKRAVLARAAAATAVNADMAEQLRRLGHPPGGIHVLPMGADAAGIRSASSGADVVPGRIMFAGRLVEKKGVQVLLDALRQLPDGLDWSLDVVGDGPLRSALEQQAGAWPGLVTFHGQRPQHEVAEMWGRCSVAVFPSVPASTGDQDGLPVTLLEAMTTGRPIVASRIPGIDEVVADGETGLLVPPGDAGALAHALGALLGDPDLRTRLAGAARRRAEDFSMEVIGDRYVELLLAQIEPARRD
jgi:glycosyltransferase involved in cell wall biosynthesis